MARRFEKLTRPALRALAPGEKLMEHGIIAHRTPSGDIRYSVNFMADGARVHRVIGLESEGVTRSDAERFIETKRTEAREDRLQLPTGRKTHLSFEAAADLYIASEEESGGRNLVAKRRHMKQRLKPYFNSQRVDQMSTFTVDKYKRQRIGEGAKPGTVNRELTTLSHFFTFMVDKKLIRHRPARTVKLEEGEGRIIALTDAECDALLKAAIADQDADCWLFTAVGLNTGMRHGEILRMRFDQIDWSRRRLLIPHAKAGPRWQPLTEEIIEILRKECEMRDDQEGWIFPAKKKKAKFPHRNWLTRSFKRAVKRAGLSTVDVTPHVMRHTAATKLIEGGADLITAASVTGHKTLRMLQRYTHLSDRHVDKAVSALGRRPEAGGETVDKVGTPSAVVTVLGKRP